MIDHRPNFKFRATVLRLVDGDTISRGMIHGLEAGTCLKAADAGNFLEASGDLINTGPTGTNVMDLMIGLKLDGDVREE